MKTDYKKDNKITLVKFLKRLGGFGCTPKRDRS